MTSDFNIGDKIIVVIPDDSGISRILAMEKYILTIIKVETDTVTIDSSKIPLFQKTITLNKKEIKRN